MKSKEVEEAIKEGKDYIEFMTTAGDNAEWAETLLSYISELEKENINLLTRLRADSVIDRDNYWIDKIRNKLIELSKKLIEPNDDRWEKDDDAYYNKIKAQILVLKELL